MKTPLTAAVILERVHDADQKLDRLHKQVMHQLRRKAQLKRLLAQVQTMELNLSITPYEQSR